MKIWISGEIENDIADDYRQIRNTVEQQINAQLDSTILETGIAKWAVIPISRATDHPDYYEFAKHHRRRNVIEFRIKMSHSLFKQSGHKQQALLLINCLSVSVDRMTQFAVSKNDQTALQRLLDRIALNLV